MHMPVNKNANLRYRILDECLGNRTRHYTNDELLEALNDKIAEHGFSPIGRTQYYKDLNFMKSEAGWSIELETYRYGKKVRLRYADPDFSIKNSPLNNNEKEALKEAIQSLSYFKGMPQFEQLEEIIPILTDKLGMSSLQQQQIILMDENPDYAGLKHISPLYHAVRQKRVLKLHYKAFQTDEPEQVLFHPYILKQYNNRWYVLGLNAARESIENRALDRILNFEELSIPFVASSIEDWEEEYFYDIIGVTRLSGQRLSSVHISVSPNSAPYIRTKPLHASQKKLIENEAGWFDFSIKVIPNYEMHSVLRSFGELLKYKVVPIEE
jgi:predicted DNA-binding transcriptional regulator YafY